MKQITIADFDNAVKEPFHPGSCILAYTGMRLHRERNLVRLLLPAPNWASLSMEYAAAHLVLHTFDKHFGKPGDEKKPELVALRASLPIDLV